jgi:MarR family transcriptional regulator, negative regulator of the multidrug operon emrRAB
MHNPDTHFEMLEANLQGLSARLPGLPIPGILLCRLIMHVGREMAANFDQQLRPFGLAEAEFRVLTTLFSQPDGVAHPSDLCARALQSPANMSRICDSLVVRELITRVPSAHDRRRMVLRITETGEELVRLLLPRVYATLRRMLGDFSEAEQRQLIAQLKDLGSKLDRESAQEQDRS